MGKQHSQKQGLRSASQKEDSARDAYPPIPPSTPVGGAFGKDKPEEPFEEELSLSFDERLAKQQKGQKE